MSRSSKNPKIVTKPGKLPLKPEKPVKPAEGVKHWHKTPRMNQKLR